MKNPDELVDRYFAMWNETDATRVVLFLDVVRPLRQPMRSVNAAMIKAIGYSPFIQDAKRRHREWEERFERATGCGAG